MLSYRHAFHAGNFADVLKHLVLIKILDHLNKKTKPWCCIDTHAGPGTYALNEGYALQNREFDNGIAPLWQRDDLPDSVARYVDTIKKFNGMGPLNHYPGSPLIIQQYLRRDDRLFLYELHSTEIQGLTAAVSRDKRIKAVHADGLKGSIGLLPPKEYRGLVLIDPSYELKNDYTQVVETLTQFHKRFATGTFALWYPVVERSRNQKLERAITASGLKNVQLFELGIKPDADGHGMTASGMVVVNPPWTLAADLQTTLPYLAEVLGMAGQGHHRTAILAAE